MPSDTNLPKSNPPFGNAKSQVKGSRAGKVNTQEMGRGKVPMNRMTEAKKGRRV